MLLYILNSHNCAGSILNRKQNLNVKSANYKVQQPNSMRLWLIQIAQNENI